MDLDLTGKHALVCGASEGIGRAAARELALLGADVTLLARRADVLETLADELPRSDGQQHAWISADVLDTDRLRAQAQALAAGKPVHILVNNTGGPPGGPVNAAESDAFERAFRQHLLANQALAQAVLPGMRAARFGRIVNVISTSVKEPIAGLGVSNTIRGAVASWAKTLATEVGGDGITVNNVLPGYTRTQRLDQILGDRAKATGQPEDAIAKGMLATVPAGRFADASELGAVIAFLCSPAAGYINGVNLPVDGGRTKSL
ncbi:3-oxoacyl-(acyl-carrier protein) reductase [Lysobacter dokdonensis DS-58]|uniref:3-oxoacyl-(Acyl-carrier protein) reductase n=1 Tax=Lysobacter dokdonensis DS-58 TaxID=1300345 RepID=A0A0A2WJD9_9GAMM|nr:SDR family oxidoreductase [Lysobacter dokdonensis]KGQ20291.1 3-oxoacyl-(acyl-carrier protein) reductase [Lysobacter dokdonensis DS-58]